MTSNRTTLLLVGCLMALASCSDNKKSSKESDSGGTGAENDASHDGSGGIGETGGGGGTGGRETGGTGGGGGTGGRETGGTGDSGGIADSGCVSCIVVTELGELRTNDDPSGGVGTTVSGFTGYSVSLSPDGNTALVGAPMKGVGPNPDACHQTGGAPCNRPGAAYVFSHSGSTWTQQAELTADDGMDGDNFGGAVALSLDGKTAIVGAPEKDIGSYSEQGAAYVFTLSGSSWIQQTELTAAAGSQYDNFGSSVSLSSDGSTALVGASTARNTIQKNGGAAYVFTLAGSEWTQQTKLVASDGKQGDDFGSSVAVSSDGNTAIVSDVKSGNVYVFARSGSTWAQQAEFGSVGGIDRSLRDQQGNVIPVSCFGRSLSLSSDDNTLLVGATCGASFWGVAMILSRSDSTWVQQEALWPSGGLYNDNADNFGASVSVSSDGNTAVIGAKDKAITFAVDSGQVVQATNQGQGAAYVFRRIGPTWQQAELSTGANGQAGESFGYAVALSSDGSIAVVTKRNFALDPVVGYAYRVSQQ